MTITYRNSDWVFDRREWAKALNSARPEDLQAAVELTGLSKGGLYHWTKSNKMGVFQHPSMMNFLIFCNLLNLEPSRFFTLEG